MRGSDLPVRTDGLQLDEPRRFQRRFWFSQRCAWMIFGATIAAALLGFTGAGGPLSRNVISVPEGSLDIPKIARRAAAETMTLILDGPGAERWVDFSVGFSDAFKVTEIQPQPQRVVALSDGEQWRFEALGDFPVRVRVRVQAQALARVRFDVALNGGQPRNVAVIVLP